MRIFGLRAPLGAFMCGWGALAMLTSAPFDNWWHEAYGLDVKVDHLPNPRVEKEDHYYNAKHTKLLELGLQPHLLSETLIGSMFDVISRYKDRVIADHILPATRWRGVRERSSG